MRLCLWGRGEGRGPEPALFFFSSSPYSVQMLSRASPVHMAVQMRSNIGRTDVKRTIVATCNNIMALLLVSEGPNFAIWLCSKEGESSCFTTDGMTSFCAYRKRFFLLLGIPPLVVSEKAPLLCEAVGPALPIVYKIIYMFSSNYKNSYVFIQFGYHIQ